MFSKKKIEKINKVIATKKQYTYGEIIPNKRKSVINKYSYDDAIVYSLSTGHLFSENANNQWKSIYKDIILILNSRVCADCNWMAQAEFFMDGIDDYDEDDPECKLDDFTLFDEYPYTYFAGIFGDWTFICFSELSAKAFGVYENRLKNIYDVNFTAYHVREPNNPFEASGMFNKEIMEVQVHCFKYEKPSPEIEIAFNPSRIEEVTKCLIDLFRKHCIELEFAD